MPTDLPNQREEVILMILVAGEKYGREIRDAYQQRSRREMPYGSLYTTLDRMEDKGFIQSRLGDPSPERGGNRRKFYKLTADGLKALNEVRQMTAEPKGGLKRA